MQQFEVLKGGLGSKPEYSFIDGAVTDTRLMGVLGLRVHFLRHGVEGTSDFYCFFYYDVEELGLDSVSVYELASEEAVNLATKARFGGLGAVMWPLNEKECRWLVNRFVEKTKELGEPLPENIEFIDFMLEDPPVLEQPEIDRLNGKMCAMLKNDYSVVHYYLMRGFGKDDEGAKLLRSPYSGESAFEDLSLSSHATFLKNTIDEFHNNDGRISYMSQSLVETDRSHYMVTSEIRVEGGKVTEARQKSVFAVSLEEASMLLSRAEYCTVYSILIPMEDFDIDFAIFSIGTTRSSHENGDMYMEFKADNEHVNNRIFNLYDDIQTLFYVSDYGELVVAAYTLEDISDAERRIQLQLASDVQLTVKMQFAHSVLYDFAQSEFTSFSQFVKSFD